MINYTFIIPHKNSPQYLNQCLNSIPRRADIQIIIVDDNSDRNIVDWDCFKFDDPTGIELVLTTEGRGAGYARNIGISKATGKWLLFPDADDYYAEGILEKLDLLKDSNLDIIYFNFDIVEPNGKRYIGNKISNYINRFDGSEKSLDIVKYRINAPWIKMVNHDFVEKKHIRFEEVSIGNDLFFTIQVGYHAQNIRVIKDVLYHYVHYDKSMTNRNYDRNKILSQFNNIIRSSYFYKTIGHKEWAHGLTYLIFILLRSKSTEYFIKGFAVLIWNYMSIYKYRKYYVDTMKK